MPISNINIFFNRPIQKAQLKTRCRFSRFVLLTSVVASAVSINTLPAWAGGTITISKSAGTINAGNTNFFTFDTGSVRGSGTFTNGDILIFSSGGTFTFSDGVIYTTSVGSTIPKSDKDGTTSGVGTIKRSGGITFSGTSTGVTTFAPITFTGVNTGSGSAGLAISLGSGSFTSGGISTTGLSSPGRVTVSGVSTNSSTPSASKEVILVPGTEPAALLETGLKAISTTGRNASQLVLIVNKNNKVIAVIPDARAGAVFSSLGGHLNSNSRFSRGAAAKHLRKAFSSSAGSSSSEAFQNPQDTSTYGLAQKPEPVSAKPNAWIEAIGAWGRQSASNSRVAVSNKSGGFIGGSDFSVFDTWRVGLLGGYNRSYLSAEALSSKSSIDSYTFGLYGGTEISGFGFQFGADYNWHDVNTSRIESIAGLTSKYKSNYKATSAQIYAEASYFMQFDMVGLEPFANIAYVHNRIDGASEIGGLTPLTSQSDTIANTFLTLGLRSEYHVQPNITLNGSLGWRRAFGDIDSNTTLAFQGGSNFTNASASTIENLALVEAGVSLNINSRLVLDIAYNGQFSSGYRDHGARAKLSLKF